MQEFTEYQASVGETSEREERYPVAEQSSYINVGRQERFGSLLGGGFLALYGISRGSLGGIALAALGGALVYRGATGHCPAYAAMKVDTAEGVQRTMPVRMRESITINQPRQRLYTFWRDVENLPTFMRHIETVHKIDERTSEWRARAPKGWKTVSWQAEITEDRPGELIAWRSLPDADVANSGRVHFSDSPDGRGTIVRAEIEYRPGGTLGKAAAEIFNPLFSRLVHEDIRRFKSLMEAGEVPTIEGQPKGS